jgi:rhodanese-related sulfurtransferase
MRRNTVKPGWPERSQASELLPKEAEIIVDCSGPACPRIGRCRANRNGLFERAALRGGKQDWVEAELPVVRNNEPRVAA